MCFGGGGSVQAPQVKQQPIDTSQLQAQQAAMSQFMKQSQAQAAAYQAQIGQQIAGITADTKKAQEDFEAELAAQQAAQDAANASAYTTSVGQGEFSDSVLSTKKPRTKEERKATLKLAQNAAASTGGAGLNIGV